METILEIHNITEEKKNHKNIKHRILGRSDTWYHEIVEITNLKITKCED